MYEGEKLNKKEGKILVKLARKSVESFFDNKNLDINENKLPEKLKEKRGVFVTIKTYPEKELRGCIGYIFPIKPLYLATIEVAKEAAFNDPRFEPLAKEELDKVIFEVTVLTKLKKVEYNKPEELLKKIKVGRDGLYIKYGFYSGVLLPQVPIEENWDEEEFLSYTCIKAGLPFDCWKKYKIDVYIFSGQIFEEKFPRSEEIEEHSFY